MNSYDACETAYKNGYEEGFLNGYKTATLEFLTEYGLQLKEIVKKIDEMVEKYKAE
jgi:flagellar biosynthesis/type III secretory pathway protein FliH